MHVDLLKSNIYISLVIIIFCSPLRLLSQESTKDEMLRKTGAQYYLGSRDDLLMKVNIWGFVKSPGQYLVPTETDLISLISFAGGPLQEAKMKSIKLIRTHGNNGNGRKKSVINVNVKKYIETGNDSLIPELLPGDTIVVSGSILHHINKFFDFASKLALIAQIYFWVKVAN